MIPVPQTSGSKGIQIYAAVEPRRGRESGRMSSSWAFPAPGGSGILRLVDVDRRACGPELRGLQPKPRRPQHHRAVLDARPGATPGVATPVTWEEVAASAGRMTCGSPRRTCSNG